MYFKISVTIYILLMMKTSTKRNHPRSSSFFQDMIIFSMTALGNRGRGEHRKIEGRKMKRMSVEGKNQDKQKLETR